MKIRILLPLCVACAMSLLACARTEVTTNRNSGPTAANSPAATPAAVVVSNDKIGVPECDDFITAYDACVSGKVPEVARAQYKTMIEQWRAGWKKLADNPNTKASLASACKQTAEQAKASMKAYNCAF